MSTSQPDYYAILGLKSGATPEEIKKRYRELARRYHPDVNPTAEAMQKIKIINEAHRILGDTERRATYDAERALRQQQTRPASASAPFSASRPASARPTGQGPRVEFNGFGRTTPERPPQARPAPPKPSAAERAATIQRLVSEAEIAFMTRNYNDAERLCRQAIAQERATPVAHEILGDIAAMRGDTDEAVKSYAYAIQYNPRNFSAQGKMDRLLGKRPSPVTRPSTAHHLGRTDRSAGPARLPREAAMTLISLVLFAGGCFVLTFFGQNPGAPISANLPWITSLSVNMIFTLICEGVIGGVLLAFYGRLRPVSEELITRDKAEGSRRVAPTLLILTLFSLVWFYASLLVYIGIAVGRNRFSVSALRVYGLVLFLITFFAVMVSFGDKTGGGWLQTAAFSGNVLFPSVLFGWFLGDCVRLRNYRTG